MKPKDIIKPDNNKLQGLKQEKESKVFKLSILVGKTNSEEIKKRLLNFVKEKGIDCEITEKKTDKKLPEGVQAMVLPEGEYTEIIKKHNEEMERKNADKPT